MRLDARSASSTRPAAPAYAHTVFGIQMTGGSTSTWSELRPAPAGRARGARRCWSPRRPPRWGVPAADCRAENGVVIHGEQPAARLRRAGRGGAEKLAPSRAASTLKDPKDWKLIGKPTLRLDSAGEDHRPGASSASTCSSPACWWRVVARPPVFGGKVKSFDAAKARAVPGVVDVDPGRPRGVAVVAEHFWAAKPGRDALEIEWDAGRIAGHLDRGAQREEYRKPGADSRAPSPRPAGDVDAALARARQDARGRVRGALPRARADGAAQLHRRDPARRAARSGPARSSRPVDQAAAARIAGLKPEQVQIHTTFLGGGFGRRATPGLRLRARGGAGRQGRRKARSRSSGRARTTSAAATTARVRPPRRAPASTPTASRSPGSTPSSASRSSRARRSSRR